MPPSPAGIDALHAHVIWDDAVLARREARIAARADWPYRLRNGLVQVLFFLATAAAGLAALWNVHDVHPALLPYICLVALTCGYFAYTQGVGNAPPQVIVSLWRQRAGAVPLEPDELTQVERILAQHPAIRPIIARWQANGHVLQKRDVDAIARCLVEGIDGPLRTILASRDRCLDASHRLVVPSPVQEHA